MNIAIIGGGNMGMAYAGGMVSKGLCAKADLLIVQKPGATFDKLKAAGYRVTDVPGSELLQCAYVFISVKPQIFPDTVAVLKQFTSADAVFVSMMAGLTTAGIAAKIGRNKVVRIMPNTPSKIGHGVTGAYFPNTLSNTESATLKQLLAATGPVVYFDDESKIDTVTAISGSGPAYFFYFVHHMIEGGVELGMERNQATDLVFQTMKGAFELLQTREANPESLMRSVTSKKGTTEAALNVYDQNGMNNIIKNALKAAQNRAQELSAALNE